MNDQQLPLLMYVPALSSELGVSVLQLLAREHKNSHTGIPQIDIMEKLGVVSGNTAFPEACEQFEAAGFIESASSPIDPAGVRIYLKETGRQLVNSWGVGARAAEVAQGIKDSGERMNSLVKSRYLCLIRSGGPADHSQKIAYYALSEAGRKALTAARNLAEVAGTLGDDKFKMLVGQEGSAVGSHAKNRRSYRNEPEGWSIP